MGVVTVIAVGGGVFQRLDDQGEPLAPPAAVGDVAELEKERPRWLWGAAEQVYPELLHAGVRLRRCHDLELVEALLLAHEGDYGAPRSVAAAHARITGDPVPLDQPARQADPPGLGQATLFDDTVAPPDLSLLIRVYQDQLARIGKVDHPGRFRLLVAAESACALIAAEMGHDGLPWRADVHDRILVDLLGAPVGGVPRRLAELAVQIAIALDSPGLHPDSPAELRKALRRAGIEVPNTRSWTLKQVDHPVVPALVEYRELYRIWTAHGWSWQEQWVRNGRFRPAYVPGGVVSGRWATRGGGALQIPKAVRGAVHADPGWKLVVADAGQLEPRILAAVSEDDGLGRAAAGGDLYAALAAESFDGDRARAKLALLGAMYGQTGGAAAPALAALRGSYPQAWAYVESAARTGETGGLVRSWLGRTCPPSSLDIGEMDPALLEGGAEPEERKRGASERARGRFTRNFVIQATAAEWAATLLALTRDALWGKTAKMVFFQHDEVIVHCPQEEAQAVVHALHAAAQRTGELLFGNSPVRFPLNIAVVDSYAEAK
ncbi:MAG TPA: bifunctional 3'-5' exonuclease/DNA polymerase [Micromonosporaceae bacterium]|nr:bifunctional 3'-5' exonuclease/DNA polymerase [Micromonosporaceae bacterium]